MKNEPSLKLVLAIVFVGVIVALVSPSQASSTDATTAATADIATSGHSE